MDELPPVLRPQEWSDLETEASLLGIRGVFLAERMAVSNALLPDDHEYKITRAEVEALRATCDNAERWASENMLRDGYEAYDALDAARRLAAKLEALLPPKEAANG